MKKTINVRRKAFCVLLSTFMLAGLIFAVGMPTALAAWNGSTPGSQPSTFTVSGNNYYINDEQALAWFAKTVTSGTTYSGKTVYLNADLNMNNSTIDGIGTSGKSFSGSFQGQGKTISNLKIYRSGDSRAALFNSLTAGATVNNLKLTNVNVSSSGSGGGWHSAVVSKVESGSATTTVSNITVTTATITGADQNGGVVAYGQSPLNISNCTVTGLTITATDANAGGIVGISDKVLTVSNCTVSGNISGTVRVGGIVGKTEASGNSISGCTFSGSVYASAESAGGIMGNLNNTGTTSIANCTNNGTVSGKYEAGGILGYAKGKVTFSNCRNNGAITGRNDTDSKTLGCAAGILANSSDTGGHSFTDCVNTGTITGKRCTGGIVADAVDDGGAAPSFTRCYNLGNVTDSAARAGGIAAWCDASGQEVFQYCMNFGVIKGASCVAGIACVGDDDDSGVAKFYRCANFGEVYKQGSGSINDFGGITGLMSDSDNSVIDECFNLGYIHSDNKAYSVGGIAGSNARVTNSFNGGNISTANHVAGIIGYGGKITNCYSYGTPSNTGNHLYKLRDGAHGGSSSNSFYLSSVPGTANSGETSKTAAELKELAGTLGSSFVKDTWSVNSGYPILKWWRDNYFKFPVQLIDGSTDVIDSTYNYNASFTAPVRSKTGYTFNGWYTASSGGSRVWGPSATTVTAGVTSPLNTCAMTWNTGANRPNVLPGTNPLKYYAQYTINTYAVTFSKNGTGYTNTTPATSVNHGGNVSFTVTLATGYTNSPNPTVTATNGTVSASKSGNTITYTVSNITSATSISVGAATINSYAVSFSKNGTGYTNTTPATSVNHGGSVSFTVTLATGYTNSPNPTVTATNGTVSASKSGNTITYT
ncbi:MAG: InlB B-repeat-containing protein, partial [Clostridiales bacterium]|nr:InlB B-repeat-containing protein [Clostridiales bacterium]